MGAGFNVTVKNEVSGLDLFIDNCSTNCMYNLNGYFSAKIVPSGTSCGGYCEAKGSGGCAFETSSYSFNIYVVEFRNNKATHVHVGTVQGTPGSGRSNDGFSTLTQGSNKDYLVTRKMVDGGNPSFTYTVKAA